MKLAHHVSYLIKKAFFLHELFQKELEPLLFQILSRQSSEQSLALMLCTQKVKKIRASFYSKKNLLLSCCTMLKKLSHMLDKNIKINFFKRDGEEIKKNSTFLELEGKIFWPYRVF